MDERVTESGTRARPGQLQRIFLYGLSRGTAEGLIALRGFVLAVLQLVLRAALPLAWCAGSVFLLSRWLPGTDGRSALLSLGVYALLMVPLLPGVVRELRVLRRVKS